jgi:hypothetical protein
MALIIPLQHSYGRSGVLVRVVAIAASKSLAFSKEFYVKALAELLCHTCMTRGAGTDLLLWCREKMKPMNPMTIRANRRGSRIFSRDLTLKNLSMNASPIRLHHSPCLSHYFGVFMTLTTSIGNIISIYRCFRIGFLPNPMHPMTRNTGGRPIIACLESLPVGRGLI